MNLLILYIFLAISISFLCSILEAVVLSISPNYLESIKETKNHEYKRLKPLWENIERPLASILTINTFAHTIGAAGAGAQAQHVFGNEWITLFSIVLTLAILFFSEIIPKTIGATYWKILTPFASRIIPVMIFSTYPLVLVSEKISKILGAKRSDKITRDELKAVVDIAHRDGVLELTEYNMLTKSMQFKEISAVEVMTQNQNVEGINFSMNSYDVAQIITTTKRSRLIVFGIHKNDIKGYVLKNELLNTLALDKEIVLSKHIKHILIVPTYVQLKTLFFRLLERKEHICAVVDDYGEFVGIVTLENILETLLNIEILDESDI
jgi:CBS domain containing-hemolysin-like protein